ncbi:MAG: DegT/DnrJ/EryC1/StrS family aminotransferase [Myxococcales bacterium]|nr:DegT/DnrJ/EryC1/StrS family aminotransferase [Myxococcales bacterium]
MPGPGSYLIGEDEITGILEVLRSGHLYRYGSADDDQFKRKVHTLEAEFAKFVGVNHAVAVNSGTTALWIAMKSLGIGPGDEVIVPAYTYVATYTSVLFAGATPVLAEVDDTLTLEPEDVAARVTERTKAIVPVHMLGNPAQMDALLVIAERYNLKVIEDCAQAAGARYHGRVVGSMGEFGAFSLNYFKTFTAGDGGLLVTGDDELFMRAFGLHDQGHKPHRLGTEVGRRDILGMNFRMNELTGAVALAQLRKLNHITEQLRAQKQKLKAALGSLPGVSFRRLTDTTGECGTLCTLLFEQPEHAQQVAKRLNTTTVSASGWHVYSNMEHIIKELSERGYDIRRGAFPKTDHRLDSAINLSVGVVDGGLGSAFGINIFSSDEEIAAVAAKVCEAVNE